MNKKLIIVTLALALCLLAKSANAMTISPLVLESELDPGQGEEKIITLMNEEANDLHIFGAVTTFKPRGENGEAEILDPSLAYQAINWVKLPINSFLLKSGEIIKLPVEISVPKTAQVGGYYLAIMWQAEPGQKGATDQVGISARVGTLLLLRVKGEAKEDLKIIDFNLSAGNFYSSLPVDFSSRLENSGNVHLKPAGHLVIRDMFNRAIALTPVNQDKKNILPQSIRLISESWFYGPKRPNVNSNFFTSLTAEWRQFAVGRFTAQLELTYGDSRQKITSPALVFWVLPWRTLLILGVIILLILIIIVRGKIMKIKKF